MTLSVDSAELSVLGAILAHPRCLDEVVEILTEDDFLRARHRILYRTLLIMAARSIQIDLVTVKEMLLADGTFQAVGGTEFLIEAGLSVTGYAHAPHHARMVAASARMRRIEVAVTAIKEEAATITVSHPETVENFSEQAQERLWKASQSRSAASNVRDSVDLGAAAVASLVGEDPSHDRRILFGLYSLDIKLLGVRPGELAVIAGRPGGGKTTLGLQIALNAAKVGKRVLFVSFEMGSVDLTLRALSNLSSVEYYKIRDRSLDGVEIQEIRKAQEVFAGLDIRIAESLEPSPATLRSSCRRAGERDLVIIDYLQYMHDPTQENRWAEVSACSHATKQVAKEFNCAVVSLAQLSRKSEGEKPMLSHLRESGNIEQDADQVVLLSCDDARPTVLNAYVAKNRHGVTGNAELITEHPKFYVYDTESMHSASPSVVFA